MDNLIGKRLDGRYLIQNLIGSGGMANVYKAADVKEQRMVAVKILREECMRNEELVRRFKNESKAISVLNHPNIVKVYDICVTEHMQYIVMECIEGITLKEYMEYRKQPLTYKETLHFVSQTLAALQHAHEKGIVHRDIKPQNIMMLPNGNIKVMDFGIARFSRSENHTMTDKAIGSVHYISPEQAKGDLTDSRADIYSVGVMMYEMLANRLPFDGDSAVNIAIKQISDTAKPLRSVNPAVPEGLEAITERAMAKDPRERYQSASAMLADISAFKRNPSIKFNYQYVGDTSPTRYLDKAVMKTATRKPSSTPTSRSAPQTSARPRSSTPPKRSAGFSLRRSFLPILAGMSAAFLVAALIICYLLFKDSPIFIKADDIPLPNFSGKTISQIKVSDDYKNFKFDFQEEYNTDSDVVVGTAFDQTPKPPKNVKRGSLVTVRISMGGQQIAIPKNVVGVDKQTAVNSLKEAGFRTLVKSIVDSAVPIGNVAKITNPDGDLLKTGDVIDSNLTIVVYVSKQEIPKEVTIPDLTGLTTADAMTRLSPLQLYLGLVTTVDNEAPAGTILTQDPLPNAESVKNTLINVQVSSGHIHEYSEEILKPATCMAVGTKRIFCSCGDSREEEIPIDLTVTGHKFDPTQTKCLNGCNTDNPNYVAPTPVPTAAPTPIPTAVPATPAPTAVPPAQ